MYEVNLLTTFRKPLWVPSSLVMSSNANDQKEWCAALYRDGVSVGGVCSVQQQPVRFKDNISAGEGVCLFFSTFPRIRETRGVQYIRRSFFVRCIIFE